jgi:uncharacterized membrane protein YdjX (TVP38/TMEM64 family)
MKAPVRIAAGLALVAILAGGLVAGHLWPGGVADHVQMILSMIHGQGPLGWVLFGLLQIAVAVSGVLPASLLGVGAGAIYGLPLGFALAGASTLAGAVLAFLLSRSLFRPMIERRLQNRPRLTNMDAVIAREGWKFVCLLRVSPVMPFAATSYTLGLSSVSLRNYLIGTLASLPALFGYVFIGTLADAGLLAWNSGAGLFKLALLSIGVLATVVLTLRIGRMAARAARLPSGGLLNDPLSPEPG